MSFGNATSDDMVGMIVSLRVIVGGGGGGGGGGASSSSEEKSCLSRYWVKALPVSLGIGLSSSDRSEKACSPNFVTAGLLGFPGLFLGSLHRVNFRLTKICSVLWMKLARCDTHFFQ